jgi:hypothetical protein
MGDVQGDSGAGASAGFQVRWTWLTTVLSVVTVASLTTLVVVVSIKNVDLLSTVALALAVLAFAAQLIVSLAQAHAATSQLTQSERINSETQSTLTDIRSSGQALLTNQTELVQRLLQAVLPRATEDAVRETVTEGVDGTARIDADELASRVESKVRLALKDYIPANAVTRPSAGSAWPAWVTASFSSGELEQGLSLLEALDSFDLGGFLAISSNHVLAGRTFSLYAEDGVAAAWTNRLVELGLYENRGGSLRGSKGTIRRAFLTENGKLLFRLVLQPGSDKMWVRESTLRHDRALASKDRRTTDGTQR